MSYEQLFKDNTDNNNMKDADYDFIEKHIAELIPLYKGKTIAVHNGKVIDSDPDAFTLAARVEGIPAVIEQIPETYEQYLRTKEPILIEDE